MSPGPTAGPGAAGVPPLGPWGEPALSIEAIIGARAWRLDREHMVLRSVVQESVAWPAHEPLEARCMRLWRGVGPRHPAPAPDCWCGIWALADPALLREPGILAWRPNLVLGVVRLWGLVVEGTLGWRASKARPVALTLFRQARPSWRPPKEVPITDEEIRRCAQRYEIPVLDRWPRLSQIRRDDEQPGHR